MFLCRTPAGWTGCPPEVPPGKGVAPPHQLGIANHLSDKDPFSFLCYCPSNFNSVCNNLKCLMSLFTCVNFLFAFMDIIEQTAVFEYVKQILAETNGCDVVIYLWLTRHLYTHVGKGAVASASNSWPREPGFKSHIALSNLDSHGNAVFSDHSIWSM